MGVMKRIATRHALGTSSAEEKAFIKWCRSLPPEMPLESHRMPPESLGEKKGTGIPPRESGATEGFMGEVLESWEDRQDG